MKKVLYKGIRYNDFKELINYYKTTLKDNPAFMYKLDPESDEVITKTYSQFAKDIEDFATSLLSLHCERVAIISSNRYEWCVSYLAVTSSGLVVVPLDKSLPDNEIEGLLKRSNADTVIYAEKYGKAVSECKNKICMDDDSFSNILENGRKLSHDKYNEIKLDPSKMAVMLFTSGTTSISKAVMLTQKNICSALYNYSLIYYMPIGSKFLSFLPLHHTFEGTITFLFGSSLGFTLCFCDGLKYISKNLIDYHIDGFVCVPLMLEIMYKKIIKNIEKQGKLPLVNFMRKLFRYFPISIRRKVFKQIIDGLGGNLLSIVSGGAPIDKETLKGYTDFGFEIYQGYGLTETSSGIAIENKKSKRVGSVGLAMKEAEFAIDKPDDDGIGEIIIKSPQVMIGYYQNEKATNEVLKDGWFYTGDLGYIDKDGFIFITGRKKDMIVLKNGKKIFPEELEILINKLPYVAESMVFGHVDNTKLDRNEDVILYAKIVYKDDEMKKLYPNKTLDKFKEIVLDDIKEKINKQMPAYKYIRKILVTDEPLIKTTTQKIKRFEELKKIELDISSAI